MLQVNKKRIIIGISGASGIMYGIRALELLHSLSMIETHLVVSQPAYLTNAYESTRDKKSIEALADVVYPVNYLGAAIASGAFKTAGMLVAPCSMRTLAAVAHSMGDNLLTRAADVVLKERRRLVLMTRETPLNLGHLRNMVAITEMGGVIFPPVPAFYHPLPSVDEMITYSVARALDLFDIEVPDIPRWGEENSNPI